MFKLLFNLLRRRTKRNSLYAVESVAPPLQQILELSKKKGWVDVDAAKAHCPLLSRTDPNLVRNYFSALQFKKYGKVRGGWQNLEFQIDAPKTK